MKLADWAEEHGVTARALQQPDRKGGQFHEPTRVRRRLPSLTVGLLQLHVGELVVAEAVSKRMRPGRYRSRYC